jgi:integrase
VSILVRQRKGYTGWWVIATYRGQRTHKKFVTKPAAEKYAAIYEKELAARISQRTAPWLLSTYFERWLTEYARVHCKPSTVEQYEIGYQKFIRPQLGQHLLSTITRADVRSLIATMHQAGKSRNTIKAYLAPLSAVFNQAIEDELIARNPAFRALPKTRGVEQSKIAKALTENETRHLLTTCQQVLPHRYPFLLCFLRTGMREGEVIALRWTEVDFARQLIHVRRTLAPAKLRNRVGEQEKVYLPKSGKYRSVPMSDELATCLKQRRAVHAEDVLVFPSTTGTLLNPANFRHRDWKRLFIAAKIPQVRIHDLRHTFATLLLEQGVPLINVQKLLGHHSIKVTADLYGHLVSANMRSEVNLLDAPVAETHAT